MNPTTANYDEPWQEALSEYFEAFFQKTGFSEKPVFWTLRQKNVSPARNSW
ncbi:MAG: hypothetical protein IM486_21870 [Microcystis sp. M114S2]|jgi:hypothetical protein|uniref:hypothetical protein n=1 Tax=Microcystis TaxID=1125 RepID=UPI0015621984|nr:MULTISPECIES: hypothetical protein [Microcystis]MCA2668378.1 hypothetical protein [Microcystis sp. M045S2]MCA2712309.1 hypothetical protein [Microcystis sp. M172S2]MCA2806569.1 hypothetical protein [Microcystis sp. M114S2]MCA2833462.1 hypothetical protein [Microcystis sp. M007S1]MCA2837487.1 hypothetical protein [Microcystis sp. M078S1]